MIVRYTFENPRCQDERLCVDFEECKERPVEDAAVWVYSHEVYTAFEWFPGFIELIKSYLQVEPLKG